MHATSVRIPLILSLERRMKARWNAGDVVASYCPACGHNVQSRFEHRTIRFARTRLCVPKVLVDVCLDCDSVLSIPSESIPQLREAGMAKA